MRVLMSAYACEPGIGSEPEIGFRTMLVAASKHEVWLLTQPDMAKVTEAWLADNDLAGRVHVYGIGPNHYDNRFDGIKGLFKAHVVNDRWQRAASRRSLELDREFDFDVIHHVTLAAYWLRTGVAVVPKPLVWGPVGGGVELPLRMVGQVGARGLLEEALRTGMRRIAARIPLVSRVQTQAAVVLAQNPDTAGRLAAGANIRLLSNALATELTPPSAGHRTKNILLVGRLVSWKGQILAIRAMRYVADQEARLHVFGDGVDRERLVAAAQRLGVAGKVHFHGAVPQAELFTWLAHAGALFHPTLHDEGGGIVAETLAMGTPVVSLDRGGPAVIAREWPAGASALVSASDWPDRTSRNLAAAVNGFLASPPPVPDGVVRPSTSYAEEILQAYEDAAAGRR